MNNGAFINQNIIPFTKDSLKETEAGAQKRYQKGTQKWTRNRIPFG